MPSHKVAILKWVAASCVFLFCTVNTASADRFLETFKPIMTMATGDSAIATDYLASSKIFRRQGKHHLADYFAARGHSLLASGKRANLNPEFSTILQRNGSEEFLRIYSDLSEMFRCRTLDTPSKPYFDVALFVDELVFKIIENQSFVPTRKDIEKLKYLRSLMQSGGDCGELRSTVKMTGFTESLWDFGGEDIDVGQQIIFGFDGSVEFYEGNFGRKYSDEEATGTPCTISRHQRLLYYEIDKPTLDKEINQVLLQLFIERLSGNEIVVVEGHADSGGPRWRNNQIAKQRAINVANELVKLGIDPKRLKVLALGAHCSQVFMGADAYVQANRRVSVRRFR